LRQLFPFAVTKEKTEIGSADPFECWDATGLKKFLDIVTAEELYPTEAIARQISSIYHSIDGHFRELEQLC